jgi:hypothetical protein
VTYEFLVDFTTCLAVRGSGSSAPEAELRAAEDWPRVVREHVARMTDQEIRERFEVFDVNEEEG